jgi:uncharacterized repeat protein (TIGR03803 family)
MPKGQESRIRARFVSNCCLFASLLFATMATFQSTAAAQSEVIYSFYYGTSDGLSPYGGVVSDGKGNLYGTCESGGNIGAPFGAYGTVFELSPKSGGGWTETILYNFGGVSGDAIQPLATMIFDSKGNLYGTTQAGGANSSSGTVFEMSPKSGGGWTEKVLHSFGGTGDGIQPGYGSLVFDAKGNLYGTTHKGGAHSVGTVFELTPASGGTWTEKVLYSFGASNVDGASPTAGVIFDAAGNLYGTTYAGGTYAYGTVFKLAPQSGGTWKESILHSFDINGVDAANPTAGLIIDGDGNLYGTTEYGGAFGNGLHLGTVYELSPSSGGVWAETVIHSFTGGLTNGDGDYPISSLTFDTAGNLYGTTMGGGVPAEGTVFEFQRSAGGWTEKLLYTFAALGTDGHNPYASLTFDAAGNLYGTTTAGGSNSFGLYGTVFEIPDVVTASPKFSPGGGAYSTAQSVKITSTTSGAAIYYSINEAPTSTKYTVPFSVSKSETISAFALGSGLPPSQTSTASYQIGTVAAAPVFSPPGGTYTVPQSVTIIEAAPHATVYYTTNGTTPTTTSAKYTGPITVSVSETIKAFAVASGYADSPVATAVYTVTPVVPPVEKVLHSFGSGTDGNLTYAGLIADGKGNLYGTTKYGGTHKVTYANVTTTAGTLFELSPVSGGWTEKVVYNFGATASDAAHPVASLIFDAKGNLYGTSFGGGAYGVGAVFELLPATGGGWTEKVLHSFGSTLTDGEQPEAGLVMDAKGNLYGTTQVGGANGYGLNGYGTVFELSPASGGTWTEKVLYSFNYLSKTDGYYPTSPLVFDSKGNLYGTTTDGGSGQDLEGGGTVFELSPAGSSWTEKILYSFGGGSTNGYRIMGGVVLDSAGNVYGVANSGGNGYDLDGTLFELSPVGGGSSETVLHSFGAFEGDGINPIGGLIMDNAGNLYGTTSAGGADGYGIVFELKKQSGGGWTEDVLHSFNLNGTDGATPAAALIFDALGNLYGTTEYGGAHGGSTSGGVAFEIVSGLTKATTTTALTSSVNPSNSGESVTFTATVKPEFTVAPTGSATFKDGSTSLGTVALSGGVAKYSTATLTAGTHSISAVYGGSTTFAGSTATLTQTVK